MSLSVIAPFAGAGSVVLATLVAQLLLRLWIRRRARQEEARQGPGPVAAESRPWGATMLGQLAPPVVLLLWIHSLYVAGQLLLSTIVVPDAWRLGLVAGWLYAVALVLSLVWLLNRAGRLLESFLLWRASRTKNEFDDLVLPLAGRGARRLLPILAVILATPALGSSPVAAELVSHGTALVLIATASLLAYELIGLLADAVLRRHRLNVRDNLQARSVHTQVMVLKKGAATVLCILAGASMLMVFDSVRQFGASILASAGVAGIVVGLAAQRSIATLLAGFQIALTQPIRVDDVVIVENEWGRIEDITLTYVVVQLWDLRRLVVPVSHFIERPFQNWTRTSSDLLGSVFLHVDYSVPLDDLRAELARVLAASPLWDGKVSVLQVTDAKEHTLEIRVLASAADAGRAWDLRCEVRERLVAFLQREHPEALPHLRATVEGPVSPRPPLAPAAVAAG